MIARRLVARGLVQGVNFRGWVRDRAESRGVVGFATNHGDGSVEVWLQGDADAVAAVERAVADGPPHARVDRLEAEDAAPRDGLAGFERR
ncbi:MAG TPA: acylphosphatase [Baekduia sp.]|uniref:acylphosphatase n=1 Tax=Baekduia sp. TaxID=2600305 RepID=UPI002D78E2DA|nr:acylphosphatase [Baekduia sp.]HET6508555.1 acylphosphatase [Baekduia sp.]